MLASIGFNISCLSISGEVSECGNLSDILPGKDFVLHNSHRISVGDPNLCFSADHHRRPSDLLRNDKNWGQEGGEILCLCPSS